MASLRFKKGGIPFVDFRAHGVRYRPEFERLKDAKKFLTLADADPVEALKFWQDSMNQPSVVIVDPTVVSLREKIDSFKENYCSKRENARDMKRVMTEFFSFILKRKNVKEDEDVNLRDISLDDLESFQTHLMGWGIENASVNRYFTTVKTFFKRSHKAGHVTINYAPLVEGLQVEHKQRESVWKDGDTAKLVEQLVETGRDQVLIDIARSMEFTPFGPKDFKRVTWPMIDFKTGFVRTYRMKGKGRKEWNLPIVPGYRALLLEMRARKTTTKDGYVYSLDGKPISPAWVSKSFERARKAVGIESVPYTSRHRAITLVDQKTDLKTASKFAGHTSTKTTEKHYVVGRDEDFKQKVNEAFAE